VWTLVVSNGIREQNQTELPDRHHVPVSGAEEWSPRGPNKGIAQNEVTSAGTENQLWRVALGDGTAYRSVHWRRQRLSARGHSIRRSGGAWEQRAKGGHGRLSIGPASSCIVAGARTIRLAAPATTEIGIAVRDPRYMNATLTFAGWPAVALHLSRWVRLDLAAATADLPTLLVFVLPNEMDMLGCCRSCRVAARRR
jgi:hypothetical protein